MKFPQYRKYKNNLSYFKIIGYESFIEWKKVGKTWQKFTIKAQILPDRNYVHDMLVDYASYWDVLSEEEFKLFIQEMNK